MRGGVMVATEEEEEEDKMVVCRRGPGEDVSFLHCFASTT